MANKSALCVHGADAYSYDTCIRTATRHGTTIGNATKYSRTTSKHQSKVGVTKCDIVLDDCPRGITPAELRMRAWESQQKQTNVGEVQHA